MSSDGGFSLEASLIRESFPPLGIKYVGNDEHKDGRPHPRISAALQLTSINMKNIAASSLRRAASTLTKEAGDISSVFPSLSGKAPEPLPARFSDLKKRLIAGNEDAVKASWHRLLKALRTEIDEIKDKGNSVRPATTTYTPIYC